jgi:NADPH:quinone reductase-like Zn-dependent oxidoreductase
VQTLLEQGKVVPVIDQCFPLEELPEAKRTLKQGKHRGKIVIKVIQS